MTTKKHDVPEELLSGLLANYKKPEDLIGENGCEGAGHTGPQTHQPPTQDQLTCKPLDLSPTDWYGWRGQVTGGG